ncbi:hypothetical protein [Hydrogenophaga sp.]|uniref:hypothetical protein n=1 Tax=Hydrogenophaga sp. TaxID=1904254 RepID=UPI0027307241|nr:hypothetical protein [Hydrogenophaga sp.]MDP3477987.1 hypothetical protein [Hydrogenophaga sp.]
MGLGALDTGRDAAGSAVALTGYPLLEPDFISALIQLGEGDLWRRKDDLVAFLAAPLAHKHHFAVP